MEIEFLKIDFELDNKDFYNIKTIINQSTGELLNLEDFLNLGDCLFYVNNLNFFYIYIIDFLIKNKFKNVDNKSKVKVNSFYFSYKNGVCSNLIYKTKFGLVKLINFKIKFGVPFGNLTDNIKLLNYANEHGCYSTSVGADAYDEFLLTIFRKKQNQNANRALMRETYPVLKSNKYFEECKLHCAGFQFCKCGEFKEIFNYDIVSSYPSQLMCDTPEGLPIEFDTMEKVPQNYFKIINFTYLDKSCKNAHFDWFEGSTHGTTTLTEHLFELFKETYNYSYIKIRQIWAFKTRKNRFDKFITRNIIDGKIKQLDPLISKYNKYRANALTGYFGRNPTTAITTINNNLELKTINKKIDPIYLPVYLFVTGKAKSEFIRTLNKNYNSVIYANTDGFFTDTPINIDLINYNKCDILGIYKQKCIFSRIFINGVNSYCAVTDDDAFDSCISGMTVFDLNNIDQFIHRDFKYTINIANAGRIQRIQTD